LPCYLEKGKKRNEDLTVAAEIKRGYTQPQGKRNVSKEALSESKKKEGDEARNLYLGNYVTRLKEQGGASKKKEKGNVLGYVLRKKSAVFTKGTRQREKRVVLRYLVPRRGEEGKEQDTGGAREESLNPSERRRDHLAILVKERGKGKHLVSGRRAQQQRREKRDI